MNLLAMSLRASNLIIIKKIKIHHVVLIVLVVVVLVKLLKICQSLQIWLSQKNQTWLSLKSPFWPSPKNQIWLGSKSQFYRKILQKSHLEQIFIHSKPKRSSYNYKKLLLKLWFIGILIKSAIFVLRLIL